MTKAEEVVDALREWHHDDEAIYAGDASGPHRCTVVRVDGDWVRVYFATHDTQANVHASTLRRPDDQS